MIEDAISRKYAIEWVQNIITVHRYYHPHSKSRNVPIDEVIDSLERVPSIDTVDAVKHGRWIPVDWAEPIRFGCSECHRMVWHIENYCPNCGARMDGEENG